MRLNPAAEGVRAASRVGGIHADVAVEDGHDAVVLAAAADWQPVGVSCAQRNQPLTSIEDTAALEVLLHSVPQFGDLDALVETVHVHGLQQFVLHQGHGVALQHIPSDARRQLEDEHQDHSTHERHDHNVILHVGSIESKESDQEDDDPSRNAESW